MTQVIDVSSYEGQSSHDVVTLAMPTDIEERALLSSYVSFNPITLTVKIKHRLRQFFRVFIYTNREQSFRESVSTCLQQALLTIGRRWKQPNTQTDESTNKMQCVNTMALHPVL